MCFQTAGSRNFMLQRKFHKCGKFLEIIFGEEGEEVDRGEKEAFEFF